MRKTTTIKARADSEKEKNREIKAVKNRQIKKVKNLKNFIPIDQARRPSTMAENRRFVNFFRKI